jgi:hypothetical protein
MMGGEVPLRVSVSDQGASVAVSLVVNKPIEPEYERGALPEAVMAEQNVALPDAAPETLYRNGRLPGVAAGVITNVSPA